ncbi:MAG: DUF3667 domain-containing protein [Ferruginibacter sp.]|nr:DUF3667 domain-containing protein [Ferruginibacter sp.]
MSHLKERKQKNCLNCHVHVKGRFCHRCGQENIEPKESVWDLISHFFKDITHFDGKFFSTVKYLVTRPGFLSAEYMIGRRVRYVNPIRLYIFTSAFFFLIFFSFFKPGTQSIITVDMNGKTYQQIEAMDSLTFDAFTKNENKKEGKPAIPMSRQEFKKYFDSSAVQGNFQFTPGHYKSKAEYDSILKSGKKQHNWFQRQLTYKNIEINEKFRGRKNEMFSSFSNILLHSLPQMLFILLPLFAGILKLLYIRRKEYYYVNHGIFSIHFYIFSFIAMLVIFGLSKLNSTLNWGFVTLIETLLGFGILFYLYKAMRRFYRQGRAKTILKFLLLYVLVFITLALLFVIFVFFSLFKL